MPSSTAITTFLRLRPSKHGSGYFAVDPSAPNKVEVSVPPEEAAGLHVNHKRNQWKFSFDGVLETRATQEEVFERVAEPVVASVFEGYNGTVFAYGQTGSGKTFTLTGGVNAFGERGIIPRTLSALFARIAADTEAEYTVRISYLEIYNETGFDLLDSRQAAVQSKGHGNLAHADLAQLARVQGVTEDADGSVRLKGLSSHVVGSEEAALNLLFVGDTNRAVSETSMNAVSSRSHCVFTVALEARPHGSSTVRRSKLHLVDLAGSERVGKSGASGTTLNEAIHINSSLFQLELVIMALHERQTASSRHVPYRNSMLTSVLRDSLGGNCKTVMVATVHPAVSHTDESISTCKFAQRVAMVKNEVSVNEEVDQAVLIARLQDENRKLREAGGGAGGSAEDDPTKQLSAEELQQLHRDVRAFVSDADPQVTLAWGPGKRLAKVRHALWILKGLLLEGWRPHRAPPAEAWSAERLARSAPAPTAGVVAAGAAGASGGVGTGGGGGGDEGPSSTTGGTRAADEAEAAEVRERREELLRRADDAPVVTAAEEATALRSVEQAYSLFTSCYAQGVALTRAHREARAALRLHVERAQAIGQTLRAVRDAVGAAKTAVEARRVSLAVASVLPAAATADAAVDAAAVDSAAASPGVGEDEEERRLCAELQHAKDLYHAQATELKHLKQQCTALQGRADGLHAAAEMAFHSWWPLACERLQVPPPPTSGEGGEELPAAFHPPPPTSEPTPRAPPRAPPRATGLPPPPRPAPPPPPPAAAASAAPVAAAMSAAAWLALLSDPQAALAEFRHAHWDAARARERDETKRALHEAYAGAKEAGELVGRKRAAVAQLKEALGTALEGQAGNQAGSQAGEERMRAQLTLETTLYKGGVASLKELKGEIESLQLQLQRSQQRLQADFESWHTGALADASKRAAAEGATATLLAGAASAAATKAPTVGAMPAGLFVRGSLPGPPTYAWAAD